MIKLKGDTLIEVTLAIGIFSMIAVIIVTVVNGSASSAQTALEITLAREEIDAQAEALRFIHSAYISTSGGKAAVDDEGKYAAIWEDITTKAMDDSGEYSPSSCSELYDGSKLIDQNAFIINTKGLKNSTKDAIILRPSETGSKFFQEATTYPRIIYTSLYPYDDPLFTDEKQSNNTNIIQGVEGIYIVAVKDSSGTKIVTGGDKSQAKSAYYDFYIRTCWYGPGADHPSTISTVIRLYNPSMGTI